MIVTKSNRALFLSAVLPALWGMAHTFDRNIPSCRWPKEPKPYSHTGSNSWGPKRPSHTFSCEHDCIPPSPADAPGKSSSDCSCGWTYHSHPLPSRSPLPAENLQTHSSHHPPDQTIASRTVDRGGEYPELCLWFWSDRSYRFLETALHGDRISDLRSLKTKANIEISQ